MSSPLNKVILKHVENTNFNSPVEKDSTTTFYHVRVKDWEAIAYDQIIERVVIEMSSFFFELRKRRKEKEKEMLQKIKQVQSVY